MEHRLYIKVDSWADSQIYGSEVEQTSQNWRNKFGFVSILMAYKTMRLDEIAKEKSLIKEWEKSSRIQPYRDLGDDNVQAEGGGV